MREIQSFFVSVWYLFRGVLKRFYFWGLSLLLDPFDFYDRYIKQLLPESWRLNVDIPPLWGQYVLIGLIGLTVILSYHELRGYSEGIKQENKRLVARQQPRLEITYREDPPFNQLMPTPGVDKFGNSLPGTQKIIRIGVHNLSPTDSIEDIRVELVQIDPNIIHHLPVPLHTMHGKDDFNLTPDETWYAEVVSVFYEAEATPYKDHFALWQSVTGISNVIPAGNYKLTIAARGSNTPPAIRNFLLGIDTDNKYYFRSAQEI